MAGKMYLPFGFIELAILDQISKSIHTLTTINMRLLQPACVDYSL